MPKNLGRGLPLPPHPQIDPIYTVCEKWTEKLGRPTRPSFGQSPKEQLLFFGRPSLIPFTYTLQLQNTLQSSPESQHFVLESSQAGRNVQFPFPLTLTSPHIPGNCNDSVFLLYFVSFKICNWNRRGQKKEKSFLLYFYHHLCLM